MQEFLNGRDPFRLNAPISVEDIDGALAVIKYSMGINDDIDLLILIMDKQNVLTDEIKFELALRKL